MSAESNAEPTGGDIAGSPATPDRVLRLREVMFATGLSRSTIYAWMADGRFPQQIKLGPRSVGWRERDIYAWIESRAVAA